MCLLLAIQEQTVSHCLVRVQDCYRAVKVSFKLFFKKNVAVSVMSAAEGSENRPLPVPGLQGGLADITIDHFANGPALRIPFNLAGK